MLTECGAVIGRIRLVPSGTGRLIAQVLVGDVDEAVSLAMKRVDVTPFDDLEPHLAAAGSLHVG